MKLPALPSRLVPAARALAAMGLVAGTCGLQRAWCEPEAFPLLLWLGALLGVLAGARVCAGRARREAGAPSRAALALLVLALVLVAALLRHRWSGIGLAGAALGLAASPAFLRPTRRASAALLAGALVGALAALGLEDHALWLTPLVAAGLALRLPSRPRCLRWPAPLAAWRVGTALAFGATALLSAAPAGGWTQALASGAAAALAGAALGTLAANGIPPLQRGWWATEALGWWTVAAIGAQLPAAAAGERGAVLGLLFAGGLCAGPALAEPKQASRGQAGSLPLTRAALVPLGLAVAILAAGPSGAWLYGRALSAATPVERAVIALGRGDTGSQRYQQAVEDERLHVRSWSRGRAWPSPAFLTEAGVGAKRLRLLTYAGRSLDVVPSRRGQAEQPHATAVLAATLPLLLSPQPPNRILVAGVGAGVAAGVTLECARAFEVPVQLIEPLGGVVELHRSVGDPFGFISGRPLSGSHSSLPLLPTLRGAAGATVVLGGGLPGPRATAALRHARVWCARGSTIPLALTQAWAEPEVLVFALGEDQLVVSRGLSLSLPLLEERWRAGGPLIDQLERIGLIRPLDLLAALAAPGPALAGAETPLGAVSLRERGAPLLASSVDFGATPERAALAQAALAEVLVRRESPAAQPLARAAVATLETSTTLRVLGDVLRLEKARGLEVEDAVPYWKRALSHDDQDVGARLSLAWYHHDLKALRESERLLLPVLGLDRQRGPEVAYLLGLCALDRKDYGAARLHFRSAGRFRNAPDLARVAQSLAKPAPKRPPGVQARLDTAKLFLRKADRERGKARGESLLDAAETLTRILGELKNLNPEQRRLMARLLRRTAAGLSALGGKAQASALARAEALVLSPLARSDVQRAVERARALRRGGLAAQAESELRQLADGPGKSSPAVHEALGEVQVAQGKINDAIPAFHKALALAQASSANSRVYLALADAYLRGNRPQRALGVLDHARRLFPGHATVLLEHARTCLLLNKPGDALTSYRAFLKLVPRTHPERARVEAEVSQLEHMAQPQR